MKEFSSLCMFSLESLVQIQDELQAFCFRASIGFFLTSTKALVCLGDVFMNSWRGSPAVQKR